MGTINKSGQSGLLLGTTGMLSTTQLGSHGTTHYSLNPGGGLVTTQWLIAGVPWSQTLRPGDTIQHSWQLGRTGTTSYNMGPGGSKTLKYTLDPSGNITESNGRLAGKSGTASYTLGPGSSSVSKATLQPGSTQSYTLGTGGSATITMVIDGIPQTVTLGPGDSSETTITSGATGTIESTAEYDSTTPPTEEMTYDVGEDGSTDNTWGDTTWVVWLFQPYNRELKLDYDPICVVMPEGEYTPGCPGTLPSFITEYPAGTNCRYIRVGTATHSITGWKVKQEAIGTLTFPTDETMAEDSVKYEEFQVVMDGSNVKVRKGNIVAPSEVGAYMSYATRQYHVMGFGVYPDGSNGSLTVGPNSDFDGFASDGHVTIKNASEGGSDHWGVYIIRNQDVPGTGGTDNGMPFLAVMATDSDAYAKTTPWLGNEVGVEMADAMLWYHTFTYVPTNIYAGETVISIKQEVSMGANKYNYNCQRIVLANIVWNAEAGAWIVSQDSIGTQFLPTQRYYGGRIEFSTDDVPPTPWYDWPKYADEHALYLGTWTDYGKDYSSAATFRISPPFA